MGREAQTKGSAAPLGFSLMSASALDLMAQSAAFRLTRTSTMIPHLRPDEKLAILQTADSRRKWYSLDDQRICVLCERTITGRQIEVIREANGAWSLRCPTDGCASLPNDWFYHGSACATPNGSGQRSVEVTLWAS